MDLHDLLLISEDDKLEIKKSYSPNAQYYWAFEPGSMVWEDELPDAIEQSTYTILINLLAIRNMMHLEREISESMKSFWELAKKTIDWPGFKRESLTIEQKNTLTAAMNNSDD